MGLFKPAWMTDKHGKKDKALAAVRKVTDQAQLAKIAREAPLGEVRTEAVSRMTDQDALYDIATSDRHYVTRDTAVRRMDEAHLVLIERVNDPATLQKFLAMLDERNVYTKPAITPPPDPTANNFIIHTRDHHDFRAIGRVREAAERRLRELERA